MHAWPSRLHAPLRLGRGPRRSTRAVRHWEKWAVGRGPLAAVAAVAAQLTNANCKGWRRHPPPRPCRAPSSPPLTRHALSWGRAITRRGDHPAPRPSVARPPDHSPATPCRVPRCGVAPVQTSAARHRQQPAPSWLGVRAAAGWESGRRQVQCAAATNTAGVASTMRVGHLSSKRPSGSGQHCAGGQMARAPATVRPVSSRHGGGAQRIGGRAGCLLGICGGPARPAPVAGPFSPATWRVWRDQSPPAGPWNVDSGRRSATRAGQQRLGGSIDRGDSRSANGLGRWPPLWRPAFAGASTRRGTRRCVYSGGPRVNLRGTFLSAPLRPSPER